MAAASYAGRNEGQMKPPSCDAAKSTRPLPATSIRCAADSFVHVMRCAGTRREALGLAAHRHRAARVARRAVDADELDEHEQRLLGRERHALVVDDGRGLAVGIEHVAEIGARRAHEVADRP